jgi:ribosomal protein S18 acetylase RimI-like enzyme
MADNWIVIRLATVEDAERVAALSTQLGYPTTLEKAQSFLARVAREPAHVVQVAVENDLVVGWIHARAMIHDVQAAEIEGLVVDEVCRGRGIGRLLTQASEQWMQERGCSTVYVRSDVIREQAHRFYEGLGYENIKTSLTFCKKLGDGG